MKMSVPESKRAEKKMPAPEKQFEVEKIIDKRRTSKNKPEYLVVWTMMGRHRGKECLRYAGAEMRLMISNVLTFPQLVPRKEMNARAKSQCNQQNSD